MKVSLQQTALCRRGDRHHRSRGDRRGCRILLRRKTNTTETPEVETLVATAEVADSGVSRRLIGLSTANGSSAQGDRGDGL